MNKHALWDDEGMESVEGTELAESNEDTGFIADSNSTELADSTGDTVETGIIAIRAEKLELVGDEGYVFGPLDFAIPARGVTVIRGAGGSGRTALALVLTGRMKPTSGTLEVFDYDRLHDIRRHTAVAGIDQVDLLERSVTVRDVLQEQLSWSKRWWQRQPTVDEQDLQDIAGDLYGQRSLPPLDAYISEIATVDKILLRVAFALNPAHHQEIELLVMDNIEQVQEMDDRLELLDILFRLGETMPVVIVTTNPLTPGVFPDHHEITAL